MTKMMRKKEEITKENKNKDYKIKTKVLRLQKLSKS